ncbi:trehalose-6-phosphate synthase [Neisseria montereyensis]|uniref:Trehalose-6-phosphate synthase n=1 Tax=Neisseria montereyensis TaxID=2973938 RepID=A0ABT2FB26_9NEIS|nr:trehalose-6-phosphate synthase [Neisseria montereyensis]MCS4533362.1 trehalose-6-phosphate synthase [Neisseria montereyensis]
MNNYEEIYDKAGEIAVKICFYGWMAALTYWVFAASPQPWDISIIIPLILAWFFGTVVVLLFGLIPAMLINILFGGLFAGLAYLKDKLAKYP